MDILTIEHFKPHTGKTVRFRGTPYAFVLDRVEGEAGPPPAGFSRAPFTVIFRGPSTIARSINPRSTDGRHARRRGRISPRSPRSILRREDALQRDAEIQRQKRLLVLVGLAAATGIDGTGGEALARIGRNVELHILRIAVDDGLGLREQSRVARYVPGVALGRRRVDSVHEMRVGRHLTDVERMRDLAAL